MFPTRTKPNILITGTPGVGKTTLAGLIADECQLDHINVGKLVKDHSCHEGRDTEFTDAYILNEDKLLDVMEPLMSDRKENNIIGGNIVDFHSNDFFPERWFDLVLVLRTDNTILYDRLEARGYSQNKIQENIEAEIMQVVLEETRNAWDDDIVIELQSNSIDDMDSNLERVKIWYQNWISNNNNI